MGLSGKERSERMTPMGDKKGVREKDIRVAVYFFFFFFFVRFRARSGVYSAVC